MAPRAATFTRNPQTRGSRQITRAIETISEMVTQLSEAHRGQTESAGGIVSALEELAANTRRQRDRLRG